MTANISEVGGLPENEDDITDTLDFGEQVLSLVLTLVLFCAKSTQVPLKRGGHPNGIRTRATSVKGR